MTPTDKILDRKLLGCLADFMRVSAQIDPAAFDVAACLGLNDSSVMERFSVGFAGESFSRFIAQRDSIREVLTNLGILDSSGRESLRGCLVLPSKDLRGNIVGLVGIKPDGGQIVCPSSTTLVGINLSALSKQEVIFTDTALKTLLLAQMGLQNALACHPEPTDDERVLIEIHHPVEIRVLGKLPGLVVLLERLEIRWRPFVCEFPAPPQHHVPRSSKFGARS